MTEKKKCYHLGHVDGFVKGVKEGQKKLREENDELRKTMVRANDRILNKDLRINSILEKLCEQRHGTCMTDADLLCDAIDTALMAIWGNTVGPES